MRGNARLLEDVLADFGIKGEVKDIRPGPVVTLYELEPSRGTKSSRVIGLAEDIARSMSVASVRAAIVPGRNAIGLELPNARRETVLLREILEADAFKSDSAMLPLSLGKSISGDPRRSPISRGCRICSLPAPRVRQSVGLNAMVLSLLYRHSPDDCRVMMIDPKMLELSVYNGIPHLLTPVITDPHKAVAALNWAVRRWRSATSAWQLFPFATSMSSTIACATRRSAASCYRARFRRVSTRLEKHASKRRRWISSRCRASLSSSMNSRT